MICKRCGSNNVQISVVPELKKRGFLSTLFLIFLLFIPIFGWIALFIIIRGRKSKTVTYAVCQTCGKRFKV